MPTLKITTTLQFPLTAEAALSSTPPFTFSLVYAERQVADISFSGAQVDQDLLGPVEDAKACFVQCLTGDGTLKVNGAASALPLKAGAGYWCYCNPDGGLTALAVSTTGDASFRVYAFA